MAVRAATLLLSVVAALAASLAVPTSPQASERDVFFRGGTAEQRAQVRAALQASSFDWSLLPTGIEIQIAPGPANWARRGKIRLSAELLDRGRPSWGVVLHEFAHQIDLLLLDEADRATLWRELGGRVWFPPNDRIPHGDRGSERFASTLAWAYWPVRANTYRPRSQNDESAAMDPGRFRTVLAGILAPEA